jgi:sterol desaturase/sphingolipid hydroxylase (fatty acid hydroxylase superfamily)
MHIADLWVVQAFMNQYKSLAIMATICMALEYAFPARLYSFASYLRGARNWAINAGIASCLWWCYIWVTGQLGVKPLVSINLGQILHSDNAVLKFGAGIVSGIVVAMVGDFFYYWMHRAQHAVPFLWRFHAVHHSVRELTTWNCNHHFTEPILSMLMVSLPLALIHIDSGVVPVTVASLITFQHHISHSSTRLGLGPFRRVFGDGRFHRVHHSMELHHWHLNFGFFTTVWDALFRTAYWPKKDEWPDVGLPDVGEPKTVREFLFRPFQTEAATGASAAMTRAIE